MTPYRLLMLPPQDEQTLAWAEVLQRDVPAAEIVVAHDDRAAAELIGSADAAFGTLTPELLAHANMLRWLQAPAAAPPAGYFFDELVAHPVVVTNLRGIYSDHVATHAMALVLALARGLQRYVPTQRDGRWEPDRSAGAIIHLPEATMLIVGLGGIGTEVARMAAVFGMRITATDALLTVAPVGVDDLRNPIELDELLADADVVVLTVPHTPETEGMIDRRRLKLMKRTAVLVNIGRGMTVRLGDLVDALQTGDIAGAGLDVFETEPLPADHALWTAPNVLLTPHTAVAGPYVDERRYGVLVDNARRFAEGRELYNVVDKALWF
jgi:phosphoglycerate dehydrogenase-like enzyme